MSIGPYWLKSFIAVGVLLHLSGQAFAQPLTGHAESIESAVINADVVVIGKLVEFDREAQDGTATIDVEETLKGKHRPRLRVRLSQPADVLAKWKEQMSPLLLTAREGSSAKASATDLESKNLAVMTADFTVLRNPKDVIQVAGEVVRQMPGVRRIQTFWLMVPREAAAGTEWERYYATGGYLSLSVPVDEQLEKRAHVYIRSDSYLQRWEGAEALRYFKSDENIARVKTLLDDPERAYLHRAEENEGLEVRIYNVRKAAYETLKYWGVDVEEPTVREEILKLDRVRTISLSNTRITNSELKELARFENLQNLYLLNTKVTDGALQELAGLKNLRTLSLGGTKVTDAGLKHLAGLTRLQYLGLGSTGATDAGLKELAGFKSLQMLSLDGSQVTQGGVAELRKNRPDLSIEY